MGYKKKSIEKTIEVTGIELTCKKKKKIILLLLHYIDHQVVEYMNSLLN
jgi:hypothetical protein